MKARKLSTTTFSSQNHVNDAREDVASRSRAQGKRLLSGFERKIRTVQYLLRYTVRRNRAHYSVYTRIRVYDEQKKKREANKEFEITREVIFEFIFTLRASFPAQLGRFLGFGILLNK